MKKSWREYCVRDGFIVEKVFIEEGESAKTANRTQFQKMLAYCAKHKGRVKRVEELHSHKERLEEAFLYERTVDLTTYDQQRDKLNEQIMLAEMTACEAKLESYDIEFVLAFGEHVLVNASGLWIEAPQANKGSCCKRCFSPKA